MNFLVNYWDKILSIGISVCALYFSYTGYVAQKTFPDNFSKKTLRTVLNSVDLALFDIDLLLFKVTDLVDFDSVQLNFQVEALKENLSLVKSISFENLPTEDLMNYQIYRKELSDAVYKIESDLKSLKNIYSSKDEKKFSETDREVFAKSILTVRDVLGNSREKLYRKKDMFVTNYSKQLSFLEVHASESAKKYGLGYVKIWYRKK